MGATKPATGKNQSKKEKDREATANYYSFTSLSSVKQRLYDLIQGGCLDKSQTGSQCDDVPSGFRVEAADGSVAVWKRGA